MPILASKSRPRECSFTMIISAWWLWTSDKFSEQKFEKILRNIARSRETPKHLRSPQTQSIVTAMKNVRIIKLFASDAVWWQEDEYVQQQHHINH